MADVYVWHAATGGGTGADWANAYITLGAAFTGAAVAGNVFYVAHDHAENTAAAITLTSPGTELNSSRIYCVDRAGSVPPVAADLRTTGVIATNGVTTNISLFGSISECYGLTISAANGGNTGSIQIGTTSRSWRLVNCKLILNNGSSTSRINLGAAGALTTLENTTVQFGASAQAIVPLGRCIWRNTPNAIQGATLPNTLFISGTSGTSQVLVEGVDLSALAAKVLLSAATATVTNYVFKHCKLHSGALMSGTFNAAGSLNFDLVQCDAADVNWRMERRNLLGLVIADSTNYRIGGATDGSTPIMWYATAAQAAAPSGYPFECPPIMIWNETVGSPITVSIEGLFEDLDPPSNDEIWIDVEYLGTSGVPLGNWATSGRANKLETPTTYPTSSASWLWDADHAKYKMSVTITPEEKGVITVYIKVCLGAVSYYYLDPQPVIS